MSESALEEKRAKYEKMRRSLYASAASLLCILALLPFLPAPSFAVPGWFAWIGRLHPLIVHFPLALVPVIAALEALYYFRPTETYQSLRIFLWAPAFAGALASAGAGYFLYGSGDYGGELAREHFWGGVVTTILIGGATYFTRPDTPLVSYYPLRIYRLFVIATLAGVVYTGHHGGMLTHGPTYLDDAMPPILSETDFEDKPREELLVFEDLILPALDRRCISCHNANKTKGGLQLTSLARMQAGGDSGNPILVSGSKMGSELYHRITLPEGDDDRMPPDNKTPLDRTEIEMIGWWIVQGASPEMKFGNGPADSSEAVRFNRYVDDQLSLRRRRAVKQRELAALSLEIDAAFKPLLVETDPQTKYTSLAVSMQIPPLKVDDDLIASLVAKTDQITSLSLVGSEITDDALYHISRLPELRSLYLAYTRIDGSGLSYLQNAPSLELVNISNTSTTNASALYLTRMPALQSVYLHETKVDSMMVEALQSFMPEVEVSRGVGPFHH